MIQVAMQPKLATGITQGTAVLLMLLVRTTLKVLVRPAVGAHGIQDRMLVSLWSREVVLRQPVRIFVEILKDAFGTT